MAVASIIIKAIDDATKVLKGIAKNGAQAMKNLEGSFSTLQGLGRDLTIMGGVGVLAFSGIIKEGAKFEDALKDAMSATGLTGDKYKETEKILSDLALQMSNTYGIKSEGMLGSYYQVLSSGAEAGTKGFDELAKAASTLNKVTGLDLLTSVTVISDAVKIFGGNMEDAGKYADTIFRASTLGKTTVPEFAAALKEAGGAAATTKTPLNEIAALLVTLSANGFRGAEAGTALRNILIRLAAPSKDGAAALKELGVNVYDAQGNMRPILDILRDLKNGLEKLPPEEKIVKLKNIFEMESLPKVNALLGENIDKIREWVKALDDGGALQAAFNEKMSTFKEISGKLWITLQNIVKTIGLELLPILTPLAEKFGELAAKTLEWVQKNPEITKTAALILGVVSAVAVLLGGIVGFIGIFGGFIASIVAGWTAISAIATTVLAFLGGATGILQIVAIIAAVAAAVYGLYQAWQTNFWGIRDITAQVVSGAKEIWGKFSDYIMEIWDGIWAYLEPLVTEIVDYIKDEWSSFWTEIQPYLETFWNGVIDGWNELYDSLKPLILLLTDWIKEELITKAQMWIDVIRTFFITFKQLWTGLEWILINVVIPWTQALLQTIMDMVYGISETIKWGVSVWEKYLKKPFNALMILLTPKKFAEAALNLMKAIYNVCFAWGEKIRLWFDNLFGGLLKKINDIKNGIKGIISGGNTGGTPSQTKTGVGSAGSSAGSSLSPSSKIILASSPSSRSSVINLNVGTLVADDSGLRSLEKILNKFSLERRAGLAVS